MNYVVGFLVGIGFYWLLQPAAVPFVTLHGGTLMSFPIAKVYGYYDNPAGCRHISACMNYANSRMMLTDSFNLKWSDRGLYYCK